MGQLVNGIWIEGSVLTSDKKGNYNRANSLFRNTISNESKYLPESNRYHLYISYACPWAHRVLIMRELKKLNKHISIDVVHPDMLNKGWSFYKNFEGTTGDRLNQKQYLHEIYQVHQKKLTTKVTVPVLWDKKTNTIVNNESSEILRIFNSNFNQVTKNFNDYYPLNLKDKIDSINEDVYNNVNNGVYKTGFAKSQKAYEKSVINLFECLDRIENILSKNKYLTGSKLTEADIRLVATLIRFDLVYHYHFKCNLKKISEYKNINSYLKRLQKIPAIKNTTFNNHIKRHYYYSHENINPFRIIPLGPN